MGDLFEIKKTLSFNSEDLKVGLEYDYITRTSQNQGILQKTGFINKKSINSAGNWSLGLLQMDFFYRNRPWYAGQFVRKIIPKIKLNNNIITFFTTTLNKLKPKLLTLAVRQVEETFLNTEIQLPTKKGKIDFDFMENFIKELEKEKIKQIDSYLEKNGLKSYKLTSEEEKVLEDLKNNNIEWGEYKLGDLFEINSSKKIYHANHIHKIFEKQIKNSMPYVVRTTKNNGIRGYIIENKKYLNDENTLTFAQDTFSVFYQKQKYFTGNKVKILKAKFKNKSEGIMKYLTVSFQKSLNTLSWGIGSTIETIAQTNIQLPIKDNQPDYKLMETLISAIEKKVIKNVVEYVKKKSNTNNK